MKVANFRSPFKGGILVRSRDANNLKTKCIPYRVPCKRRQHIRAAARSPDKDSEREESEVQASSSGDGETYEVVRDQALVAAVGTGTFAALACVGGGGGSDVNSPGFGGDGGGGGNGSNPLFEVADAEE
jgi:hypothetical protein